MIVRDAEKATMYTSCETLLIKPLRAHRTSHDVFLAGARFRVTCARIVICVHDLDDKKAKGVRSPTRSGRVCYTVLHVTLVMVAARRNSPKLITCNKSHALDR